MKKYFVFAAVLVFSLVLVFAAVADESAPVKERITLAGIITDITDIDGDGVLDKGGKAEIMLFLENGTVKLAFTEDEFDDMALAAGEEKNVDVSAGAYAVNAVVSAEYFGFAELLGKDYFRENDTKKIKECMLAACRKNGEDAADTVFPKGNEVYSTYINGGENAEDISFIYDAESGNVFPLSELGDKIKSVSEGEMLALFGDVDGDGLFDVMDIKSYSSFAPVSAEWNAAAGVRGKALSYLLFDRELRAYVPDGRTFSAKNAEGAGLCLLLANEKGEARLFTPALCKDGEGGYARFGALRNAKIISAETAEESVKVIFEGGQTVLLPTKAKLAGEITAEIFFEVSGKIGAKTVKINSWFNSLAELYEDNGAESLSGKTATAVFGADGTALYFEINE